MPDSAPLIQRITGTVPAQGTAGTLQDEVVARAPFAGAVSRAAIIPEAASAADATNNRTFRLVNKGQAGVGTTGTGQAHAGYEAVVEFTRS